MGRLEARGRPRKGKVGEPHAAAAPLALSQPTWVGYGLGFLTPQKAFSTFSPGTSHSRKFTSQEIHAQVEDLDLDHNLTLGTLVDHRHSGP